MYVSATPFFVVFSDYLLSLFREFTSAISIIYIHLITKHYIKVFSERFVPKNKIITQHLTYHYNFSPYYI